MGVGCHSLFTPVPGRAAIIDAMRIFSTFMTCAVAVVVFALVSPLGANRAQAGGHAIAGAWTLNNDLSDQPGREQRDGGADSGRRGGGRGPGGGGRRGGGGFGGGWGGRGGGRGAGPAMNPDDMARMRDAMRDLTSPPSHLTIVETDSMIVMTSADGRTTRLAPDGKKVKDDNTGIERKTKWDGEKLVTEFSGLGPMGKATQTIAADPENHQLRIVLQMEGGRAAAHSAPGRGPRSMTHVYDDDKYTK
jgi:hypothetical protein